MYRHGKKGRFFALGCCFAAIRKRTAMARSCVPEPQCPWVPKGSHARLVCHSRQESDDHARGYPNEPVSPANMHAGSIRCVERSPGVNFSFQPRRLRAIPTTSSTFVPSYKPDATPPHTGAVPRCRCCRCDSCWDVSGNKELNAPPVHYQMPPDDRRWLDS